MYLNEVVGNKKERNSPHIRDFLALGNGYMSSRSKAQD